MEVIAQYFASISILAILSVLLGLTLMVVEMFLPGFGAPGIAGMVLLILGVGLWSRDWVEGAILAAILVVLVACLYLLLARTAAKGAGWRSPVLLKEQAPVWAQRDISASRLVGASGMALTALKPEGTVLVDDEHMRATTQGEPLEPETAVEIVDVQKDILVVRAMQAVQGQTHRTEQDEQKPVLTGDALRMQQKDWQEERPEPLLELRSSPSDDAVETAARTAPDAKDPMGTNDDVQREA